MADPQRQRVEARALARVDVAGVEVALIDRQGFADLVVARARSGERLTVGYLNAHGSNLCARDAAFREALAGFDLVLCDSRGLQLGCRLLGVAVPPQVTSLPDLYGFPPLFAAQGIAPFFLGSRPGVAAEAARRLERRWPGFRVAGTHHGYLSSDESAEVIHAVNTSGAPVLIVGLGMPRQERWIAAHRAELRAPVVIAAGKAFDWFAGVSRPAPRWLGRVGLEWAWRLAFEPRRLWGRYLVGNPRFVARLARERARGALGPGAA